MATTKKRAKTSNEPYQLHAVCAGKPVPNAFCDKLDAMVSDAREGKVTAIAWVAIGPDFARWGDAFVRSRSDRMNILGQLSLITNEIIEFEKESEAD